MNADQFYNEINKENFYLGIISQVYRNRSLIQVENLSLFKERKIKREKLIPNTINFYVVIEDIQGLFIGEVYQSKVQDNDVVNREISSGRVENVFPEMAIDIIGYLNGNDTFMLPGFKMVGVNDKVYVANENITEKYLESLETNIYYYPDTNCPQSKIKGFASIVNNENAEFSIQPNSLMNRHLLVVGATNSGKSTSALSILDELFKTDRKILIIDPTGEYSESFPENTVTKLNLGKNTFLPVGRISMRQWEMLFQTNDNTQGSVLSSAIKSLRYQSKEGKNCVYKKKGKKVQEVERDISGVTDADSSFDLMLLAEQINEESVEIGSKNPNMGKYVFDSFRANTNAWLVQKVRHEFSYSSLTDFFSNPPDESYALMDELDKFCGSKNESLYIDASNIGTTDGIGAMIIDLISNYLIGKEKEKINPFVMFIDEVHRYTHFTNESIAVISGITNIAREGRKKGIFLFLTTQSPVDVPKIVFSQIGTLLIHRLTSQDDLYTVFNYLDEKSQKRISKLNQGEAILTSINLLQDLQLKFNKSSRKHDNVTPVI
ncbi:ATP-binding protein [Companilactobacillus kedongensis]|uniref:ATP-binding protein n=1 Tax=Companilactobacillus kedongensis TaxID=2486004 RepID=UPI000F783822|nr:ATP-binding protein [Companilactobacillus kedongensis]